jgi:hypothetical protein
LPSAVNETVERFQMMSHPTHVAGRVDKHTVADQFSFLAIVVLASGNVTIMMRKLAAVMVIAFFVEQIVSTQFDVDFFSTIGAFDPTTRDIVRFDSIVEHVVNVVGFFK